MQRDFSQGSRKLGCNHHCATLWNPLQRQLIQACNVNFEEPTDVSTDSTDFSTNSTVDSTNPTDVPLGSPLRVSSSNSVLPVADEDNDPRPDCHSMSRCELGVDDPTRALQQGLRHEF
jgi:hypothetical protein